MATTWTDTPDAAATGHAADGIGVHLHDEAGES
jgi:hypothetical protein